LLVNRYKSLFLNEKMLQKITLGLKKSVIPIYGGSPPLNEPRHHYCIMEILINITDYVSVNFHQNYFFSDSRKTSLNP